MTLGMMENSLKLIIYGNGAMAKVLYSYIRSMHEVIAFTVDDHCVNSENGGFMGYPLLPFSQIDQLLSSDEHRMIVAVGYKEMNSLRARKCTEARQKGYRLASYIHPSVMRHEGVEFGENCIVLDHVSIHPDSRIADGTFISSNVNVGHDCSIGEMCWINAGVAIAGGAAIGARSFLGVNASVAGDVKLGSASYIAANTLVNKATDDEEVLISAAGEKFLLGSEAFLRFTRQ